MIWAIIWYWILGIFTVSDIITTTTAIQAGAHEVNPVMVALMDHLVAVKFAYLLAMIGVIVWMEKRYKGSGWTAPAGAACITSMAVISNVIQLGSLIP